MILLFFIIERGLLILSFISYSSPSVEENVDLFYFVVVNAHFVKVVDSIRTFLHIDFGHNKIIEDFLSLDKFEIN